MTWNKLSKSSGVSWGKNPPPVQNTVYKNFNILQEDGVSTIMQEDKKSRIQFTIIVSLWTKLIQATGKAWNKIH